MSNCSDLRDPPSPWLIIVTGRPAAGKSTLAAWLGEQLRLPVLSKDAIKETLFDALGWSDREWSKQLGRASVEVMFRIARAVLGAGQSLILDNAFSVELASPVLRGLQEDLGARILQVICTAPSAVLYERFRRRAESGARHPGHVDLQCLDEFQTLLAQERPLRIDVEGPVIEVDTTDLAALDWDPILELVVAGLAPPTSTARTSGA